MIIYCCKYLTFPEPPRTLRLESSNDNLNDVFTIYLNSCARMRGGRATVCTSKRPNPSRLCDAERPRTFGLLIHYLQSTLSSTTHPYKADVYMHADFKVAGMKRTASPIEPSRKEKRRQDPVSCSLCRSKKLKCSREAPCSNCRSRGLKCDLEAANVLSVSAHKLGSNPAEQRYVVFLHIRRCGLSIIWGFRFLCLASSLRSIPSSVPL